LITWFPEFPEQVRAFARARDPLSLLTKQTPLRARAPAIVGAFFRFSAALKLQEVLEALRAQADRDCGPPGSGSAHTSAGLGPVSLAPDSLSEVTKEGALYMLSLVTGGAFQQIARPAPKAGRALHFRSDPLTNTV
jgi:hypothetical protein